jgi:hypothetical protein
MHIPFSSAMRDTGCFVLGGAAAHSREDGSLHFVSTVQWFGKSGWSSRALRAYTENSHPVQVARKMPLAYEKQRAPESESSIFPAISMWCATLFYEFL